MVKKTEREWEKSALLKEIRKVFTEENTLWSFLEGQAAIFQMSDVCGGELVGKRNSMYKGTEVWISRLFSKLKAVQDG